tara:strand:+ start:258 stop:1529 length:1272 start_codon:yes stop_codon:yes gene_type:complete
MLPNLSALQTTGAGANDGIPAMSNGASGTTPPAIRGMYQNHLLREGWVVIPTALGSDAVKLQQVRDAFDQHFRESPELLNPRPEDPTWRCVLGPFAALGNPSSFHHPFVRAMREMCEAAVLDHDALPLNGRRLEQCFDRILRRVPGDVFGGESWHRDEAKHTQPGDDIFGGWINLDLEPQYFSCAPGTHNEPDARGRNDGFAKITSPEEKARYKAIADAHGPVAIPPGHILIFYERLVHEVLKRKTTHIMRRLFLGWRATNAHEPLFGQQQTDAWIQSQAPAKIKSGQATDIFPSAYVSYPKNYEARTKFSKSVFVPQCLYLHRVASGEHEGQEFMSVLKNMKGLADYGMPLHRAYDEHERKIMFPSRRVKLRTFEDPSGPRVAFRLASVSEWETYDIAPAVSMDAYGNRGWLGRPGPERVEE